MAKPSVDIEELRRVAALVSERLTKEGVPHLLIGGLAVASCGYVRATRDVDFLVSRDDLSKLTGQPLTIGVTQQVLGVDVDFVTPEEGDDFLESFLLASTLYTPFKELPVAVMPVLVFLKLKAGRRRDQGDVVELIKRGKVDIVDVRDFLARRADEDIRAEFEALLLQADSEED